MTGPILIPVHVGLPDPASPSEILGQPALQRRNAAEMRTTPLKEAAVDWRHIGVEPRWLGAESVDCVAALEPARFNDAGAKEIRRFLDGAKERDETALLISTLGCNNDTAAKNESFFLSGLQGQIRATILPAGARPRLAPGLGAADQDLGKRLLSRQSDARWWTLALAPTAIERSYAGAQKLFPPPGELEPVLIDALGKPVVAAWLPAEQNQRWYIVPDGSGWESLINWLVQQAIPSFVPEAARRFRTAGVVDLEWQTTTERHTREAVAAMELRHAQERQHLETEAENARRAAETVRDGLLYGSGGDLERAVEQVLNDAGIETVGLDATEKRRWSADLLASAGTVTYLVEVKSESGSAKETLVGDLLRHLETWRSNRADTPVDGGTLIVNHQRRRDPAQRESQIYRRPELVQSLTVNVVGTVELFGTAARSGDRFGHAA